ncbi:MAG: fluoride efflux transporter CrcB [Thermoguttaceae bacterium]|nr:fluoride efflux transporter CrcB [Thermoguttaceae bacterium]
MLIFLGGGIGTILRWTLGEAALQILPKELFPLGTFTVNLVGCFGIGLFAAWFSHIPVEVLRAELRVAIIAGFFGGFTTFSSFGLETLQMLHRQQWGLALGYVTTSVVCGVICAALGFRLFDGQIA